MTLNEMAAKELERKAGWSVAVYSVLLWKTLLFLGFYISIVSTFSLISSRRLSTLKYSSHSVHGFIDSSVPDVHLVSMCNESFVSTYLPNETLFRYSNEPGDALSEQGSQSSRSLSTLEYTSHSVHGFIDSSVPDVHLVSMSESDDSYVSTYLPDETLFRYSNEPGHALSEQGSYFVLRTRSYVSLYFPNETLFRYSNELEDGPSEQGSYLILPTGRWA
jgi:hypothetical protein